METSNKTQIIKDIKNKKLKITRDYGMPGHKVNYWINGGHPSHGKPKQNRWISRKVVFGSMPW